MMHLLLDIGNSSTKVALHDGSSIVRRARFGAADPGRDDALREWIGRADVDRAGAVSVVPAANLAWSDRVEAATGRHIEFFDHASRMPFELVYETPKTLGNDRIAAAAGGVQVVRTSADAHDAKAVIAVDTGTAVTYELVTVDGQYRPGPIAPGPELLRRAVKEGTAQLPLVDLEWPESLTGAGTMRAIQVGIMAGFCDAVDGMLSRLIADTVAEVDVVLTGGWAEWLAGRMSRTVIVEPDLVLLGVRELMDAV